MASYQKEASTAADQTGFHEPQCPVRCYCILQVKGVLQHNQMSFRNRSYNSVKTLSLVFILISSLKEMLGKINLKLTASKSYHLSLMKHLKLRHFYFYFSII